MEKKERKAVRCYLIKENKVVVTKYKQGNRKEGYYDIPGGKIEQGETPKQAATREMKEETGIEVEELEYKGDMIIEYPDRRYRFDVFLAQKYEGEPQEFEENASEWIEIEKLLQQEKLLSNILLLDRFFRKGLLEDNLTFEMYIEVNEEEAILGVNYKVKER